MRDDSKTTEFFQLLCLLPQGLPKSKIPVFETLFSDVNVRSAVSVLKQCALIHEAITFLRVLSPVRLYMQNCHRPPQDRLALLQGHYHEIASRDVFWNSPYFQEVVVEMGNITAMLDI